MNGSVGLEGVHGSVNALDLDCLRQTAGSPQFQLNDGVLRLEMRWPHVFLVVFHYLWVWIGRTDVSERVCGLGRGPWQHKCVNALDLECDSRIAPISAERCDAVFGDEVAALVHDGFHCLWVCKGRTDVSERVCGLGRGWSQPGGC